MVLNNNIADTLARAGTLTVEDVFYHGGNLDHGGHFDSRGFFIMADTLTIEGIFIMANT